MELVRTNLPVNNYDMIRRPEFIREIKNVQLCIDLESRAFVTNPTRKNVRHDRKIFFRGNIKVNRNLNNIKFIHHKFSGQENFEPLYRD